MYLPIIFSKKDYNFIYLTLLLMAIGFASKKSTVLRKIVLLDSGHHNYNVYYDVLINYYAVINNYRYSNPKPKYISVN